MSSSPLDHKLKIDTEEAQKRAIKNVARMLQRPDQLEKVDQFHKEFERKRMGNESRLKTAVQSQLEGVKTGIEQLSLALRNVREVKTRMRLIFKKSAYSQTRFRCNTFWFARLNFSDHLCFCEFSNDGSRR